MTDPSAAKVASDAIEHAANGADKAFEFTTELVSALGTNGVKLLGTSERAAAFLGTQAAHLTQEAWNVLVNQQIASGVVGVFRWAFGWVMLYLLSRATRAAYAKSGGFTRENGPTRATWLSALCGVMFCAQVVFGYLEVPIALKQIINPRYYAAVELIQAARLLK